MTTDTQPNALANLITAARQAERYIAGGRGAEKVPLGPTLAGLRTALAAADPAAPRVWGYACSYCGRDFLSAEPDPEKAPGQCSPACHRGQIDLTALNYDRATMLRDDADSLAFKAELIAATLRLKRGDNPGRSEADVQAYHNELYGRVPAGDESLALCMAVWDELDKTAA